MTQLALVCMKMEDDCLYVVCKSRMFPHFLALSKFQESFKIFVHWLCLLLHHLNQQTSMSFGRTGQGMCVSFSFGSSDRTCIFLLQDVRYRWLLRRIK